MTIDDADSCWLLAIASSSASLSSDFKHCTDLKNLSVWSQSACDDRKEVTVTKEGVNRERERVSEFQAQTRKRAQTADPDSGSIIRTNSFDSPICFADMVEIWHRFCGRRG